MTRSKIEILKDWVFTLELLDESDRIDRPKLEARERELAAEAAELIGRERRES